MRRAALAALVAVACSDEGGVTTAAREVVWTTRTITREESWDVERLVLRAGSTITVQDGVYLRVRATELVVEGPVTVDARGHDGAPLDRWISSGGALNDCEIAHRDWSDARDGSIAAPGVEGGNPGAPGGSVTILARRVVGRLEDLHVDIRGGAGGAGRALYCGCEDHNGERWDGPTGAAGRDGVWTFLYE